MRIFPAGGGFYFFLFPPPPEKTHVFFLGGGRGGGASFLGGGFSRGAPKKKCVCGGGTPLFPFFSPGGTLIWARFFFFGKTGVSRIFCFWAPPREGGLCALLITRRGLPGFPLSCACLPQAIGFGPVKVLGNAGSTWSQNLMPPPLPYPGSACCG